MKLSGLLITDPMEKLNMNGVEALRSAFNASYFWYDGTTANVTEEQANFQPQGNAHSIAALAIHIQQSEDWFFNHLMQGGARMWESEGWGEKLGLPDVAQLPTDSEVRIEGGLEKLQAYQEAVRAKTAEYLNGLSDQDLAEELDMSAVGMGTMRRVDVITGFVLGNTFAHTGEISAIKGLQGATGYPF